MLGGWFRAHVGRSAERIHDCRHSGDIADAG